MKRGDKGMFSSEFRTRYFLLHNASLYYFNSWEDYGSMGLKGATNFSSPIQA